jgi:hypothetical protein
MDKYKRVVQIGFDVAVGENVSSAELESLCEGIRGLIDDWYDSNGKAVPVACVNGIFPIEDMSHAYDEEMMKVINEEF